MNKIIEKSKRAPIHAILMALMAIGAILEPNVAVADPWAEKQDLPSLRRSVESDMAYAAILELGRRKDTTSVARLQKLASCDEKALAATDMHVLAKDGIPMAFHRLWACRAAKAALTSMKAADYFGALAADYSVAHGDPDKYELTVLLGYTEDSRAIKLLGPMLLDRSCLDHSHPQRCHRASDTAALALSRIIQPGFVKDSHMSYTSEWKQWWIAHRAEYGDTSPLPSTVAQISSTSTVSQSIIIRSGEAGGSIAASSDAGQIDLAFDSVKVQLPASGGRTITVNISMVLAPQNGPVWWKYKVVSASSPVDDASTVSSTDRFYLAANVLRGFSFQGNRIVISDGVSHYQNADAALSALIPLVQKKLTNGDTTPVLATRGVDLWKVLGQQFFLNGGRIGAGALTSIALHDGQWVLSLSGPNNDSATVTLDGNYKVVGATLNSKAVYP